MAEYINKDKAKRLLHIEYAYAAEQLLDEIPAADVATVVHGRWENGYCSNCGRHAPFWSISSCYYKSNYCPNCGTKMDGGDNDAAD